MKRLLSLFVAGGLAGCSSVRNTPVAGDRTNPYFVFFEQQPPEFKKSFRLTPFSLFTLTAESFNASLRERVAHDGVLSSFAAQPAHGDFHPLQARSVDGVPSLIHFDSAAAQPWWWDVLRMETGASVLAAERSLKLWHEGACVDSYAQALSNEAATMPAPVALTPIPGHEQTVPANLKEWPLWQQARPDVTPALSKAFERALPNSLNLKETRRLPTYTRSAHVALASDESLWEFREVADCQAYLAAMRVFHPETTWRCLTTAGHRYGAWPYPRVFTQPTPEDFVSESALTEHVTRLCRLLAEAHGKSMSGSARRELALALTHNRLLRNRLKAYAHDEAQRILEAYRLAL